MLFSINSTVKNQPAEILITPAFCGSVDLASRYVPRHNERYGRVGVRFRNSDLQSDVPLARLLLAGVDDFGFSLLSAVIGLDSCGRFFGVRHNSAVGTKKKW
ncbi:MAG TPA: hypothetical protein VJB87_03905, partial [Candidatus Nanoarchaeia archaeon]|nr:hypothetical protein [Candidatus Nanoarchaeia archaeon]